MSASEYEDLVYIYICTMLIAFILLQTRSNEKMLVILCCLMSLVVDR
jgi:hypothetical protein